MSKGMWAASILIVALLVTLFAADPLGLFADPKAGTSDERSDEAALDLEPGLEGRGSGKTATARLTSFEGEPVGSVDLGLGAGLLRGTVLSGDAPLALARVRPVLVDGQLAGAVRTRTDGTYEIRGLPMGQHEIRATAEGHVGRTTVAPLLATAPDAATEEGTQPAVAEATVETIVLELRVEPQNGLDIKVTDSFGRPVPGAKVLATTMQWDLHLSMGPEIAGARDVRFQRGRTDERGKCLLAKLHPDRYNLVVSAPAYVTTPIASMAVAENRVRKINVSLQDAVSMTGTVVDQAGAPVENAIVGCLHTPSFVSGLTTRTDKQGRWTLEGLRRGGQMIFANHDQGGQVVGQGKAPGNGITLKLGGSAVIKGKLTWSDGSPVTKAEIRPFSTQMFGYVYSVVDGDVNADGSYELRVPFGSYSLRVRADNGQMSEDVKVQVEVGEVLEKDIVLSRTGVVRGVVTDADGRHLSGAEVYVRMGGMPPSKSREHYARTDDDGQFEVAGLEMEQIKLRVSHEEYADQVLDANPLPPESTAEVTVRLQRGATVRGMVRDAEGQPIPGEQIAIFQHMFEPRVTVSGPDGAYAFHGVAPGTYSMKQGVYENMAPGISKSGVNVGESGDVVVDFDLAGANGTVRGVVRLAGKPLPGASVNIMDDRGSGDMVSTTTDENGRFEAQGVKLGTFNVFVSSSDNLSTTKRGTFGKDATEATIEIDMGTAGVRGRIVDQGGQPVSGAWVTIESTKPEDMAWSQAKAMKNTSGDGVFVAGGLSAGNYRVRVQTAEHAQLLTDSYVVKDGILDVGDLKLKAGGVISGRITDDTGAPVEDATVSLLDAQGQPVFLWSTATTGSDGRYALHGVAPAAYTVTLEAKGYSPARKAVTLTESGATVDGTLTRGGTLRVAVKNDAGYPVAGARVTLVDSAGRKVVKTLSLVNIFDGGANFTDKQGVATLRDLAAGTYKVRVEAPGYDATGSERSAVVSPGETGAVEIQVAVVDK